MSFGHERLRKEPAEYGAAGIDPDADTDPTP